MVMTGKRSGLDSAVRAGCPNGGISDKARSLVRYLVGNGGDTMHNMDVRNYDHDLPYKFGMSEDVGYDLICKPQTFIGRILRIRESIEFSTLSGNTNVV